MTSSEGGGVLLIRETTWTEVFRRFSQGQVRVRVLFGLLLILACLTFPALAAPVGTFIQVEGAVEVLRQGKPPAVPVKVQDGVDKGDMVRTKSQARAQLRFVDDSTLTLAPGSSVLIEDYHYDGAQGLRQAALNLFRGLAYCVVNRILKTEEPDFVVKTQTAVLGVRGTRFFVLAALKFVGGYNELGKLEMLHRATGQKALLGSMEFAVATQDLSQVQRLSPADLDLLRQWLAQGVPQWVLTGAPPFSSLLGPPGQKLPALDLPKEMYDGMFVPPTPKPEPSRSPKPGY